MTAKKTPSFNERARVMREQFLDTNALWLRAQRAERKALEPGFRRGRSYEMAAMLCDLCDNVTTTSVAFALLGDARTDHFRDPVDKQVFTTGPMGALRQALLQFPEPLRKPPKEYPEVNRDARRLTLLDNAVMAEFIVSEKANATPRAQRYVLDECRRMTQKLRGHDPKLDAHVRQALDAAESRVAPLSDRERSLLARHMPPAKAPHAAPRPATAPVTAPAATHAPIIVPAPAQAQVQPQAQNQAKPQPRRHTAPRRAAAP